MPEGSRVNGHLKLIVYVLIGGLTVGLAFYAIGASGTDSLKVDIQRNEECIRILEQDSAAVQADLHFIKTQLDRIEDKLDKL